MINNTNFGVTTLPDTTYDNGFWKDSFDKKFMGAEDFKRTKAMYNLTQLFNSSVIYSESNQ